MQKGRSSNKSPKSIAKASAYTISQEQFLHKDTGTFTFYNGDKYEGEYKLHKVQNILVKHEYGTYITDDFEVYSGRWSDDNVTNKISIRFNNGMKYNGGIDENNKMTGNGTYTFPDGSSIEAMWIENQPVSDVTYQEPLGFIWITEHISNDTITFIPGNHFWDEITELPIEETFIDTFTSSDSLYNPL